MKTITIGRGDGANIIIDDEMISRRHAILKISTFGKMEIVDMGKNGTFVNGIKLRPNVPFPVTRKDVINFADVSQLDWTLIPDKTKYYKYVFLVIIALIAVLLLIFLLKGCENDTSQDTIRTGSESVINSDTPSGLSGSKAVEQDSSKVVVPDVESKDSTKKEKAQIDVSGKTVQQLFPTQKKKEAPKKDSKKEKEPQKEEPKKNKHVYM